MASSILSNSVASSHALPRIEICLADATDRPAIYRLRHQVYALELGQHEPTGCEQLTDALDHHNLYLKACVDGRIAGFVSITPPGHRYSVDKYFERKVFPFAFDNGVYEVRLLTVVPERRRLAIATLLMHAAMRWIETEGGTRIVAIGRREVLRLYLKAGLKPLGRSTQSGAVTYELLTATVAELRESSNRRLDTLRHLKSHSLWRLAMPFLPIAACRHGGDSFEAIGESFDNLGRARDIINGDVLDAWFPPSPRAIASLEQNLPFLVRTSPPTASSGFVRAVAKARGLPTECIVPAAGSSELIFLAFREWLRPDSSVLLLDPTYGEYGHVTERIVGCRVDRLKLVRAENYQLNLQVLEDRLRGARYDLVVIVNPNSPTGQYVPRPALELVLKRIPVSTQVWIDETYVDYVGSELSLESFAATSRNTIVCKSMSKVYALSGVRAAYVCGPSHIAARLREISPPWAVSLPAQLAAVRALDDPEYYAARYRETRELRERFAVALRSLGFDVIPSVANFLLCHLPEQGPDAATICWRCREHGVYVRDAGEISPNLGSKALRIAVKDEQMNQRIIEVLHLVIA